MSGGQISSFGSGPLLRVTRAPTDVDVRVSIRAAVTQDRRGGGQFHPRPSYTVASLGGYAASLVNEAS